MINMTLKLTHVRLIQFSVSLGFSTLLLACQPDQSDVPETATKPKNHAVTLIHNGTVLTINEDDDVIENGVIAIEGNEIIAVGGEELRQIYREAHTIDANGGIVLPGMVNAHNHLSMVAFRGIGEAGFANFEERLVNYFFPLEANLLDRNLIHVSARHAALEMAEAGVTTTADMYYHEDEVARAVKQVGIRGVLGETVLGFPTVDASAPYGGLEYAENFIKDWIDDPLITPAVAPHAPYTVSPEMLKASKALADKYDVPVLIHMDEIEAEEVNTLKAFPNTTDGKSIVEYLDGIDFFGPNVVAAHVNHVTDSDIQILKERGVGISHNPKANTKDMSGLSPAWDMYERGLKIGLGTDGPMSSNQMDIISVMPHVSRISRIKTNDVSKFQPRDVLRMATLGGAKALGMDEKIGSLEVGKLADIVIVETNSLNMRPNYAPFATMVFAAYPSNVSMTMVNGDVIYRDGKIQTVDITSHLEDWADVTSKVEAFNRLPK